MKISNIIRRGGRERGREREGGHSNMKSLIKLERDDPKNKVKKKYNYIKIREDEKLKT